MTDHKHHYKITFIKPPRWKRIFGAPSKLDHRCTICHKTIDEVIAELEVLLMAAENRLLESLANFPPPGSFDHGDGDICEEEHP